MVNKERILSDMKDLILTLHRKGQELKTDPTLLSLWQSKNMRLQEEARHLTLNEAQEMECEYQAWFAKEFPDLKNPKKSKKSD